MLVHPFLSLLLSSLTTDEVRFTVNEGGLWIDGQRPGGRAAAALGWSLDHARLERALNALLAGPVPDVDRGSDEPYAALWAAIQAQYDAA